MKIEVFSCMKCLQDDGKPSDTLHTMFLNDDGFYELVCERGHETLVLLQEHKFQILFEIGTHALLDGYPDAATSRFVVALERFYEFYMKVIFLKQGIKADEFLNIWKHMAKHSERQFGAFLIAYQLDKTNHRNKSFPELIENEWIKFRNDVLHKGYIPSDKEARDYGRRVFNFIAELLIHLTEHYQEEMTQVTLHHLTQMHKISTKHNTQPTTMSIPTLLSRLGTGPFDFDKAIAEIPKYSEVSIKK